MRQKLKLAESPKTCSREVSEAERVADLPERQPDGIGVLACGELLIHRVENGDRNDKCPNRSHIDRAIKLRSSTCRLPHSAANDRAVLALANSAYARPRDPSSQGRVKFENRAPSTPYDYGVACITERRPVRTPRRSKWQAIRGRTPQIVCATKNPGRSRGFSIRREA
jgi:hypothetical protein